MKIKAKDVLAQVDMKYLQDVSAKLDGLAKDFANPLFVQFKPVMDKLVQDYRAFMAKQQTTQQPV